MLNQERNLKRTSLAKGNKEQTNKQTNKQTHKQINKQTAAAATAVSNNRSLVTYFTFDH